MSEPAALKLAEKVDQNAKAVKFRALGAKRMNRVLKLISLLGNLSNRSSYFYSDGDVKKIIAALRDAIDRLEARFTPKDNGGFSF